MSIRTRPSTDDYRQGWDRMFDRRPRSLACTTCGITRDFAASDRAAADEFLNAHEAMGHTVRTE